MFIFLLCLPARLMLFIHACPAIGSAVTGRMTSVRKTRPELKPGQLISEYFWFSFWFCLQVSDVTGSSSSRLHCIYPDESKHGAYSSQVRSRTATVSCKEFHDYYSPEWLTNSSSGSYFLFCVHANLFYLTSYLLKSINFRILIRKRDFHGKPEEKDHLEDLVFHCFVAVRFRTHALYTDSNVPVNSRSDIGHSSNRSVRTSDHV